jgi:hypothetical protein
MSRLPGQFSLCLHRSFQTIDRGDWVRFVPSAIILKHPNHLSSEMCIDNTSMLSYPALVKASVSFWDDDGIDRVAAH